MLIDQKLNIESDIFMHRPSDISHDNPIHKYHRELSGLIVSIEWTKSRAWINTVSDLESVHIVRI